MKRAVLLVVIAAVGVAVMVPASASALTITSAGRATSTGNVTAGTSTPTFSFNGLAISCTTHTITVIVDAGKTSPTVTQHTYAVCTYTFNALGISGVVAYSVTKGWSLTANTTTSGTLTSTTSSITFTTGGLAGCTITVPSTTVAVTFTNTTHRLNTDAANSVPFTATGCIVSSGTGTQTETLLFSTITIS